MKLSLLAATLLTAAMLITPASAQMPNRFPDVPLPHWAYDAVDILAQARVLTGYPDGTFRGRRAVSRFEAAEGLARLRAEAVRKLALWNDHPFPAPGRRGEVGPAGPRGPRGPQGPAGPPAPNVSEELTQIIREQEAMRRELDAVRRQFEESRLQLRALRESVGELRRQTETLGERADEVRRNKSPLRK
jgi:hypothetical protein